MNQLSGEAWIYSQERYIRDVGVSILLGAAACPAIAAAHVAHSFVGDGSFIYRQMRLGSQGEEFEILKIRTLREGTPITPTQGVIDNRATAIGSLFRKAHIDELPQLINIVRGDMALFGPRPLIKQDIENMRNNTTKELFSDWWYAYTHSIPGGISSHAIRTRWKQNDLTENQYALRAISDVKDYLFASPEHDLQLLGRAAVVARSNMSQRTAQ